MASCESQENMPRRRRPAKICIKCKSPSPNLVIRNVMYCRMCSLALIEQRFKRAIDSSLPQKREDDPSVLAIAYSGGLGSTVLLDLASRLLTPSGKDNSPRRRWKEIHVLHIEKDEVDCSSISPWAAIISRYPEFKFKALRLEDDFYNTLPQAASKPSLGLLTGEPSSVTLEQYLRGLPTESARVTTIRNLTRLAVEQHARALGASHLLLGTSLSSISSAMISRICQGGGFTLASERGNHTDNLSVVVPLQDVMAKECAAWLKWNDLQTIGGAVPRPVVSIESLTRDFMTVLERDYPSTVSTVSKTLAKIVPKGASDGECQICQRPIQKGANDWINQIAITSPRRVEALSSLHDGICYECHSTHNSTSRGGRESSRASG